MSLYYIILSRNTFSVTIFLNTRYFLYCLVFLYFLKRNFFAFYHDFGQKVQNKHCFFSVVKPAIELYKQEVTLWAFLWKSDRFQGLKIQLLKTIKGLVLSSMLSVSMLSDFVLILLFDFVIEQKLLLNEFTNS